MRQVAAGGGAIKLAHLHRHVLNHSYGRDYIFGHVPMGVSTYDSAARGYTQGGS
jgi:hypothetical protein